MKIENELTGFTILFDPITKQHGVAVSAVFGQVWRYCQMKGGRCWASQQTLADDLQLTRVTLNKHLSTLVTSGYLKVEHQDGGTNIYYDTGKIRLKSKTYAEEVNPIDDEIEDGGQNNIQGVSKNYTGGVKNFDTSNTISNTIKNTPAEKTSPEKQISENPETIDPLQDKTISEDQIKQEKQPIKNNVWEVGVALAEVTGMDMGVNKGQLLAFAKKMKSVDPEYILKTYSNGGEWYTQHWKGLKNQKPNLKDITETLYSFTPTQKSTIKGDIYTR